ncbi:MAG: system potassium uptake protein, partial [Pseudonocardiales bacterium]|nr:system potassium uptake protein [Pseudonocardiales bacterium]
VEVRYGFQDRTDLPEALRRAPTRRLEGGIDADHASYFLSGITLIATRQPTMTPWRKRLFVAIARDTGTQGDYLRLPHHRTLVIEAELECQTSGWTAGTADRQRWAWFTPAGVLRGQGWPDKFDTPGRGHADPEM